jgi:DNA (cytosine-5)-methyltransferase 1
MITIGSLFSGIGGFELGLERAIPNSRTLWQVEQDSYCQTILGTHWPEATIHNDVCQVGIHNLEPVDIICGGFPCQDISLAGKQGGIHAKRSGLWWQMHRIISELRPRVAVMENVPNLITLGLSEVLGSLSQIGYDAEWTIISAAQFGAPHKRERCFIVAYSNSIRSRQTNNRGFSAINRDRRKIQQGGSQKSTDSNSTLSKRNRMSSRLEIKKPKIDNTFYQTGLGYWGKTKTPSAICRMDDGIPYRLAKLRALGNAIVPQCSEYIGQKIVQSGLLDRT